MNGPGQSGNGGARLSAIRRALRVGVLLALAIGGVWLASQGVRGFMHESPPGLSASERALERDIDRTIGRRQLLSGGALLLLSIALRTLWRGD